MLMQDIILRNKRLLIVLSGIVGILMIPLIAMQFTSEVNWDGADFIVMGGLLLATAFGFEIVTRTVRDVRYRAAITLAILAVFLLVWAELAVGLFGSPFAGN